MEKIIGIVIASMVFANIAFAEMRVIESKTIKDGRVYNHVAATVCVDGHKFVVWSGQSISMVQFYEKRSEKITLPAKC